MMLPAWPWSRITFDACLIPRNALRHSSMNALSHPSSGMSSRNPPDADLAGVAHRHVEVPPPVDGGADRGDDVRLVSDVDVLVASELAELGDEPFATLVVDVGDD